MSGQSTGKNGTSSASESVEAEGPFIVANVRRLSGVNRSTFPDDDRILNAVRGVVEKFDLWYSKVIGEAVGRYRKLIIARVNPFVRNIEFGGFTAEQAANRLVEDYSARNFVTAGGWALEAMAIRISPDGQKSTAAGIDLERRDPTTGEFHLYVLKSGIVTRNSDILSALKRHVKKAEQLLRQDGPAKVHGHYAVLAGATTTNFHDGINRPSSAEFWSDITGLPERQALDLVLAVAAEAGRLVRRDAAQHIGAMKILVREYIADPADNTSVDWTFLARRNMEKDALWEQDDKVRHARALTNLLATGYVVPKRKSRKS